MLWLFTLTDSRYSDENPWRNSRFRFRLISPCFAAMYTSLQYSSTKDISLSYTSRQGDVIFCPLQPAMNRPLLVESSTVCRFRKLMLFTTSAGIFRTLIRVLSGLRIYSPAPLVHIQMFFR